MLLIVGGAKDHNINRLARAAARAGVAHRLINTDSSPAPALDYASGSEEIRINGESFGADGAALFIRYDVFGGEAVKNAAFYDAIKGWALSFPSVKMLNRGNEDSDVNKVRNLRLARALGFKTPETRIASDFNALAGLDKSAWIAKPVSGGSYTKIFGALKEADFGKPWFIQEKLAYPEMRVFRVGGKFFAFAIDAATLDCRADREMDMVEIAPPEHIVRPLRALSDRLGLTYAAADFKTRPGTNELLFLEINTMPMFTGYDDAAQGKLSAAIIEELMKPAAQPAQRTRPGMKP
jgi:hypothetical protein